MIKLHQDEKHLHTFRRHPIILLAPTVVLLIFALAPLLSHRLLPFGALADIAGNTSALLSFLYLGWITILWLSFSTVFVNHWLDFWVITDKRLLDFEQRNLFHRETSITRLENIQDISIEVHGILATVLDYGDIHVQTAGTDKEFVFKGVAQPKKVKQVLSELSRTKTV